MDGRGQITTHLGILGRGVEEDPDAVPRGRPLQDRAYLAPAPSVPHGLRVPSGSARGSLRTPEPRAPHPPPCLTPSAQPWLGPLTMPWAPRRPGPVTLICTSTSQAEKRTGTLLHTAPLRFCMDGASRTSSRPSMASVDQGSSGPGPHRPRFPHHSLSGLGWARGKKEVTSRPARK